MQSRLACVAHFTRFGPGVRAAFRVVALLALACGCAHTAEPNATGSEQTPPIECLPDGGGYLRARLSGAIEEELHWENEGTECSGAMRPTDGGIRLRFGRLDPESGVKIVLVFGVADLREGRAAKALPVNVTVIREGTGEFYGTQGDDKCMLDDVRQEPIVGIPHRSRAYRVIARGFCTEPARAIQGQGAVLLSRFDFAGRVDFEAEDTEDDAPLVARR